MSVNGRSKGDQAMAPNPTNSLAINFEFAMMRPREVRPSIRYFCIHCGQLILRKISKIGATRCHILRLKCTKFDFRWSPSQTPLGSLQRSPRPNSCTNRGLLLRGGREKRGGKGKGGKEKEKVGEGREERVGPPIGESGSASGVLLIVPIPNLHN